MYLLTGSLFSLFFRGCSHDSIMLPPGLLQSTVLNPDLHS